MGKEDILAAARSEANKRTPLPDELGPPARDLRRGYRDGFIDGVLWLIDELSGPFKEVP